MYHDFERPRNGELVILTPETPVTGSQIWAALAHSKDLQRYTPHVYSGEAECFVPISAKSTDVVSENSDVLHATIDVKLVQQRAPVRADDLLCDSSSTALTGSWFGIGIVRGKTASNHGSLWRSALQFGAAMTFTIGKRYEKKVEGSPDIYKTHRQIPCVGYEDVSSFMTNAPIDAQVVVVEYGGESLTSFSHPKRAVYVLGSEDNGVPPTLVSRAHHHVAIPTAEGRPSSLNVAAAGSIILYDRFAKMQKKRGESSSKTS